MAKLPLTELEQAVVKILAEQEFGLSYNAIAHDLHLAKMQVFSHALPQDAPTSVVRASFIKPLEDSEVCRVTICSMGPHSTPDHFFITGVVGTHSQLADLSRAQMTLHAPGIKLTDFLSRIGSRDVPAFLSELQIHEERALKELTSGLTTAVAKPKLEHTQQFIAAHRPWLVAPLTVPAPTPAA